MKTCSFTTGVTGFTWEYMQHYLSREGDGSTDRLVQSEQRENGNVHQQSTQAAIWLKKRKYSTILGV